MQPNNAELVDVEEPKNWFTEMKQNKVTKPNLKGQRSVSDDVKPTNITTIMKKAAAMTTEYNCSLIPKESKVQKVRPSNMSDKDTGIAYVDLKDDLETQNRYTNIVISTVAPFDAIM